MLAQPGRVAQDRFDLVPVTPRLDRTQIEVHVGHVQLRVPAVAGRIIPGTGRPQMPIDVSLFEKLADFAVEPGERQIRIIGSRQ
jgi:hypothetical protein